MNIFNRMHHVCIVVHDVEKSAEYYAAVGIGPWRDYPSLSAYTEIRMPNDDAFKSLKFKYANLENMQVQLCQPGPEDGPQRRFLDTRGEGVFHLGFEVPDCDAAEKAGTELGLTPLMSGRRDDKSGFTYFDTAERAGVVLEVRSTPAAQDR